MSRSTFDAAAAEIAQTPRRDWVQVSGGSIAGFPVSEAHRFGHQVWFRYSGTSGVLDFHTRYLAYLPDGYDRHDFQGLGLEDAQFSASNYSVTDLGGGWYYVHDWAD
jgi:hypothetical protein